MSSPAGNNVSNSGKARYVAISLVAMAILSLEVVSMRVFAVENYSSFGYLILSVALLGFGFSGALLALGSGRLLAHSDSMLRWTSLLFPLAIAVSGVICRNIPFVPQKILADQSQIANVALLYFVQFLPFFVGSMFIGLLLVSAREGVGKMYAADLLGSGVGGLITLGVFYLVAPDYLMLWVVALALAGHVAITWPLTSWSLGRVLRFVAVALASVGLLLTLGRLQVSEYKGISYTLSTTGVTGAEVVATTHGPLGLIQVVSSNSERSAAGLSTIAPMEAIPPVRYGVYVDGNRITSIAKALNEKEASYLDWTLTSLAYDLRPEPRTIIVGLGGGVDAWEALKRGAKKVLVAEINNQFIDLLQVTFKDYTGNLLEDPRLEVQLRGGRDLARNHPRSSDLVFLNMADSSGLSFPGARSIGESYTFTLEAVEDYLSALDERGVMAVLTSLQEPPRASLRLLPAAVEGCRRFTSTRCESSVVFLRGELFGLLLVMPDGFSEQDLDVLQEACFNKGFDISYHPGMSRTTMEDKASQEDEFWADFNQTQGIDLSAFDSEGPVQDPYFDCLSALMAGEEQGANYLQDYPFDIRPTSDNQPYFDSMLKDGSFEFLKKSAYDPENWVREIPPDLWAEPLLLVTLIQSLLFGALIIIVPLLGARSRLSRGPRLRPLIYFSMLGLCYMLLEMVMMQWLTIFLAESLYSASLVLAVLLVFSGLGSSFSSRFVPRPERGVKVAVAGILVVGLAYIFGLHSLLISLMSLPMAARILIAAAALAPLGFFMGMPFPLGMTELSRGNLTTQVAWGWGINGAISVSAIVLAQLLAIRTGFVAVMSMALVGYLVAGLVFGRGFPSGARE